MIPALVLLRLREGFRRPFPYVAAISLVLLALASRSLLAFSFGAERAETANLVVSAVFLAGLLHAAFLGTAAIGRDLERGTLGWVLTKPLGTGAYLLGTYLGITLCSLIGCGVVGFCIGGLLATSSSGIEVASLAAACTRALLAVLVLEAAAVLASAALPRVTAPIALLAFFLVASLGGSSTLGWLAPDFALFGLESGATAATSYLGAYALLFCATLLLLAYIVLGSKPALRANP